MIIEGLFNLLFGVVGLVINLVPQINVIEVAGGLGGLGTLLAYGLYFFPLDLWIVIISNISMWVALQGGWAVIEWVYKKIPGVD